METTTEFYDAQALNQWVHPDNLLSSSEARAERQFHNFLVGLFRPKPSEMMLAFVAVFALSAPPVNGRIGK